MYREDGHHTNQAYMAVGSSKSLALEDPPCLRGSTPGFATGNCTSCFISVPGTCGPVSIQSCRIQLLKEYMAKEIGVERGEIIAASKGSISTTIVGIWLKRGSGKKSNTHLQTPLHPRSVTFKREMNSIGRKRKPLHPYLSLSSYPKNAH